MDAAEDLPPQETVARQRAISSVGEHWDDVSRLLAKLLGLAYREDNARVHDVAVRLMRRYQNGGARLVPFLRENADADADEIKKVLLGDVSSIYRELLKGFGGVRVRANQRVPWSDEHHDRSGTATAAAEAVWFANRSWSAPGRGKAIPLPSQTVDGYIRDIAVLLDAGEEAWANICADGVFDCRLWTKDQKWTAIGMMWPLTVEEIRVVRRVKAGNLRATLVSTRQMMTKVRRKGQVILNAMSDVVRREHDLPRPTAVTPVVEHDPGEFRGE